MILTVRTKQGDLRAKDILDIDFDMSVREENGKFVVRINRTLWDMEQYATKEEAEDRMMFIADMRNRQEMALEDW